MTKPDFRALCAELLADYDNCHYRSELSDRARAALAQPEPVAPTDEEIMELMPQQMRDDLAAAAQAILDAFENASDGEYVEGVWVVNERTMLAAALRAAADQVAPSDAMEPRNHIPMALECQRIRKELLTIADELESQ
jgi:hypothetical protein